VSPRVRHPVPPGLPSCLALALAAPLLLPSCRGIRTSPAEDPRSEVRQLLLPEDAEAERFRRADLLISQWDAAQTGGRTEASEELFHEMRQEVDRAYPVFVSAARGERGLMREYLGVSALGFASNPGATAVLVERLRSEDPRLVGNALIAIRLREDPDTNLRPVIQMMGAKATGPRRYAPLAVASVLDARQRRGVATDRAEQQAAAHMLSNLVVDQDPYVRLHAAKALGALGSPGTQDLLTIQLKDEHVRIQVAAAAALERIGDPRAFPDVVRLLEEAPEDVKPIVRDILASYAARIQGAPLAQADVERIGTSAIGWTSWYNQHRGRGGAVPASAPRLPPRTGAAFPAPEPSFAAPPASPSFPAPSWAPPEPQPATAPTPRAAPPPLPEPTPPRIVPTGPLPPPTVR
jgi:hypothetical protein